MSDIDRRANQIINNSELYQYNNAYRNMVDYTVYLSDEERRSSQQEVDRVYGVKHVRIEEA